MSVCVHVCICVVNCVCIVCVCVCVCVACVLHEFSCCFLSQAPGGPQCADARDRSYGNITYITCFKWLFWYMYEMILIKLPVQCNNYIMHTFNNYIIHTFNNYIMHTFNNYIMHTFNNYIMHTF